jgi:hypothetical protein
MLGLPCRIDVLMLLVAIDTTVATWATSRRSVGFGARP